MADEVEIINVGGRNGVASEATLDLLLREFQKKSSNNSQAAKDAARLQALHNKAVKDSTTAFGKLKDATDDLSKSFIGRVGKQAIYAGDRLGDFAEAAFGAASILTSIVRYGDDTIDTLRGLTSVGASFNNSMFDMIAASANSAMNMEDFASLVQNNATTLATFGANVTSGTRLLGQFSKDFRRGVGNDLFSMGFTIADVNEGLIGFLDLERRRSNASLRTDRLSQEAAMAYVLELDKLTKLTGEEREQVAERLAMQVQDAGVRAQVNRLEGQARANLQSNIAFLDSQLSGPLADALMDLTDGVAQTDVGKALANQVPGITEFARRMFNGQVGLDEMTSVLLDQVQPALENFSTTTGKATLDQLRGSGGVTGGLVSLADQLFRINQLQDRNAGLSAEEQAKRDKATSTLGGFEQAITDVRKTVVDAFLDASTAAGGLFDSFGELMTTIGNLIAPEGVDGSIPSFQTSLKNFMTGAFGQEGYVTKLVSTINTTLAGIDWDATFLYIETKFNEFTGWLDGLLQVYKAEGFSAALEQAGTDIVNTLLDFFLGKMQNVGGVGPDAEYKRVGGLFAGMYDSIISFMDGTGVSDFMQRVYDTIYEFLFNQDSNGKTKMQTFLSTAYNSVWDFFFPQTQTQGPTFFQKVETKLNELLFPNALSTKSFVDNVVEYLNEFIYGTNSRPDGTGSMTGGILSGISDATNRLLEDSRETLVSLSTTITNAIITTFDERLPELLQTIVNSAKSLSGGGSATQTSMETGAPIAGSVTAAIAQSLGSDMFSARIDPLAFYGQMQRAGGIVGISELNDRYQTRGYLDTVYGELQGQGLTSDVAKQEIRDSLRKFITDNYNNAARTMMLEYLEGPLEGFINELPAYNIGTNGFQNFGNGTPVMVHNEEAIVPKNSPAGQMLESYYSGSQDQVSIKIDQLNTTMMQVVKLLAAGNQISEKTAKGLRGMTTDFYRGARV